MAWDSLLSLQGEPIEVLPVNGAAYIREAVFEETSIQVDAASGMLVRTANPTIGVFYKAGEEAIAGGDKIKRKGLIYRAESIVPDGQGGAKIELHKLKGE